MKRIFRRNQIIITTLAVMIAAAGYLNYSAKMEAGDGDVYEAGMMEISDEDILAENQAGMASDDGSLTEIASLDGDGEELLPDGAEAGAGVEAGSGAEAGANAQAGTGVEAEANAQAGAGTENGGAGGTELADSQAGTGTELADAGENSGYIAGVQLNREQIRAKNKETLMQLINSDQVSEAEKQTAVQNMIQLTEISEKENAAETLLKAKGFVDPVVSITDGQVDVVVNAVSITDQERAQIEDIVKRKTEVGAEGIVITLLDLAE